MTRILSIGKFRVITLFFLFAVLAAVVFACRSLIWEYAELLWSLVSDREKINVFISSFGLGAPLAFIAMQVFQVLIAPIPGEASGFIGGYLFGALPGFIYSSIGLTLGSWINFSLGRLLGKHWVLKLIPQHRLDRFNSLVKRQGVIVIFILFVFPGFPKDYLCLFLGLSAIPIKVFMVLAGIGRMPGTFALSLQGAYLYERMYGGFALIFCLCLIAAIAAYRYRERLYQCIERYNNQN